MCQRGARQRLRGLLAPGDRFAPVSCRMEIAVRAHRQECSCLQAVISWLLNNPSVTASTKVCTPNKTPGRPTHSRNASLPDELSPFATDGTPFSSPEPYQRIPTCDPANQSSEGSAASVAAEILPRLRSIPGNTHCADCGAACPEWASITHGALVCIDCSGARHVLHAQQPLAHVPFKWLCFTIFVSQP